jgi:ribose-phosphate pyrophosphokinase
VDRRLGGTPLAFIHKTRDPMTPNEAVANRVVGDVAGRTCVVVDDMIDTGGTIVKASEALFDAGAADVVVAANLGVFSGPAIDRLKNSRIAEVVVTRHAADGSRASLRQADGPADRPLIARAIREVFRRRVRDEPLRRATAEHSAPVAFRACLGAR